MAEGRSIPRGTSLRRAAIALRLRGRPRQSRVDVVEHPRTAGPCSSASKRSLAGSVDDMAVDKCEEDLRALGAVTTNCEELVAERPVDYESSCEPDEWPPPPI
jgi:hypothetical protein